MTILWAAQVERLNRDHISTEMLREEEYRKSQIKSIRFSYRNPYDSECLAPYKGPVEPGIALGGYKKADPGKSINYKLSTGLTLTYLINNSRNKTAIKPALEWELKLVLNRIQSET